MQLNDILLTRGDYPELTETHLEHHVFFEQYFLADHDECACG